jgi:hypothetical protein
MIATNGTLWNVLQRVRSMKTKALKVKYNLGLKNTHPQPTPIELQPQR